MAGNETTAISVPHYQDYLIVRRIFHEYAGGMSPRQIVARFNAEGIPSPRGGQWNASTINGNRKRRNGILNNELYLGQTTYNRQRFVKNPETGKRASRPNPESEWTKKEVPQLRVIDDETWDQVQAIKGRYSSHRGNRRQTKKRLFTGLVKCGCCRGSMTIVSRERYYCSVKRERGTCTNPAGISAAELEDRVLSGLKDILFDNEDLMEAFAAEFKAEIVRLRKERGSRQRQATKDLSKTNKAIARCLTFITEGDDDPTVVRDELRALEARKRDLEQVLAANYDDQAVEIHPNIAELYRRKVSELQSLLSDESTRSQSMDLIRSMIDRIEVHEGEKRGNPDVMLIGALARILAYAQESKTTVSARDGGRGLSGCGGRRICPSSYNQSSSVTGNRSGCGSGIPTYSILPGAGASYWPRVICSVAFRPAPGPAPG